MKRQFSRQLEIVTLVSFAVLQPVLWSIGNAPVFLVAHDVSGWGVVVYALVILGLPSVAFLALDGLTSLLPARWQGIAAASLRGLLLALIVAPVAIHAYDVPAVLSVSLLLGAATLATWLWLKLPILSNLVRALSFAPLVFVIWFVGFSGARAVAFDGDEPVALTGGISEDISVVWVIFDQLPLSLLVNETGDLREGWFPNFARLADESTWFTGATTVSNRTSTAVPAALTGVVPEPGALPVASEAPVNLFTLLGRTHEVHAWETFTQLCPDSVCQESDTTTQASLVNDTWVLTVRRLLGDRLSDHLVARVDETWAGFGGPTVDLSIENEATSVKELAELRTRADDRKRVDEFIASLESSTGPSLHYLHLEKPHEPLLFLPDGRIYDQCACFEADGEERWPETRMTSQRLQAYVIQTMYADTVLGRILDALDSSGEPSVVVVMSDHGVSLMPGTKNRVLSESSLHDILPVPVFVRMPDQDNGTMDDRPVQTTSILPTVLDALGMDWTELELDGVSLLDTNAIPEPGLVERDSISYVDEAEPTKSRLVEFVDQLLPDSHSPYVFGPEPGLFGTTISAESSSKSALTAKLETPTALAGRANTTYAPALVSGELLGADSEVGIAIAVDDKVVGSGWSFYKDFWRVAVMVDPSVLDGNGPGRVRLFEIADTGLEEIDVVTG